MSSDIAQLKSKLAQRKKLEKMTPGVERAKEGLVRCLREKDRRPLDCWREVEEFKKEVGVLERRFVDQAGR